jgi:hypothetical protein
VSPAVFPPPDDDELVITSAPCAAFCGATTASHVPHVVGLSAYVKMVWINTVTNVAFMQHESVGGCSVREFPRNSVSVMRHACGSLKPAIAPRRDGAGPKPASTRALDFVPEPVWFGFKPGAESGAPTTLNRLTVAAQVIATNCGCATAITSTAPHSLTIGRLSGTMQYGERSRSLTGHINNCSRHSHIMWRKRGAVN